MLKRTSRRNLRLMMLLAMCMLVSGRPVRGDNETDILALVPDDTTLVFTVDVARMLEVPYLREAAEDRLENDLAPFHDALAERGYGLDDIGRRLAVFANFGQTERRSPERFGFIIRTGIAEEQFAGILESMDIPYNTASVGERQIYILSRHLTGGRRDRAVTYLDSKHVLVTDRRRMESTLERIHPEQTLDDALKTRLAKAGAEHTVHGALAVPLPDHRRTRPVSEVERLLGMARSVQRLHYAENGTYTDSMEELERLMGRDFRTPNVNFDDLSIVSADDSRFVILWEGDIDGYLYTTVTINEAGEFERSGRKEDFVEQEVEQYMLSGYFRIDFAGAKQHGAEGRLILHSNREDVIAGIYRHFYEFRSHVFRAFENLFEMPRLGAALVEAFDIQWPEDDRLEFGLALDDEVPRFLELLPRFRLTSIHPQAVKNKCNNNLRHLGLSLAMYRNDHRERMPEGETSGEMFRAMEVGGYLHSREVLICPGHPIEEVDFDDPEGVGYYVDPTAPQRRHHPMRAIAACRPPWQDNHEGDGVNVLFADSSVKFIRPGDSGPPDKISNPYIEEDTDIYADTGDPQKHAWIRWAREPE